jgi:phosphate transport system substrate-binding protein
LTVIFHGPTTSPKESFVKAIPCTILALLFVTACSSAGDKPRGDSTRPSAASGGGTDLTGAGASFPYPLYSKWTNEYLAKTGERINYQPSGSGAGVKQLSEGTVDFGGSDGPMTDAELAAAKHGPVLHIPTTLGAVVVTYNVPGVAQPLRMTPDVVADIFLRKITKWNDPRLAASNPGVTLPTRDILVAHRSDGSGTTFIFTDYLSKVSPAWAAGPGKGKAVSWPAGTIGGKANEGVAAQVQQTEGAVGYVELAYAAQNRLPAALIRNAAGNFVAPTIESITAAAAGVADTLSANSDYRISIVNAPGANAYPISSFTWVLLYQNPPDAEKGRKLVDFLKWGLTEGQQYAASLHYAPLPQKIVDGAQQKLSTVATAKK